MSENKQEKELPPDIENWFDITDANVPIDCFDQEELIYNIRAKTGLEFDAIRLVLKEYFEKIRNIIANKENVNINGIGKLTPEKHNLIKRFKKCRELCK
jgi:hypothetical protein